jgi:hypothetical protein
MEESKPRKNAEKTVGRSTDDCSSRINNHPSKNQPVLSSFSALSAFFRGSIPKRQIPGFAKTVNCAELHQRP